MYTISDIKKASPTLKDESLYTIEQLNYILKEIGEAQIKPPADNYNILATDAEVIAKNLNAITPALLVLQEKWDKYYDSDVIDNIGHFFIEVVGEQFAKGGEITRYDVMDKDGAKLGDVFSFSENGAHALATERYSTLTPGDYSLNFSGREKVSAKHFAEGGSVGVVGAFFNSIDLEALPPKVAYHIKTELLSDPDLELVLSDEEGREKFELVKNLLQPFANKTHADEPKPHAPAKPESGESKKDQQEKEQALANRLELLREMLEEEPENETLRDRIELLEEMLAEQIGNRKYKDGGSVAIDTTQFSETINALNEIFQEDENNENPTKITLENIQTLSRNENDSSVWDIEYGDGDFGWFNGEALADKGIEDDMVPLADYVMRRKELSEGALNYCVWVGLDGDDVKWIAYGEDEQNAQVDVPAAVELFVTEEQFRNRVVTAENWEEFNKKSEITEHKNVAPVIQLLTSDLAGQSFIKKMVAKPAKIKFEVAASPHAEEENIIVYMDLYNLKKGVAEKINEGTHPILEQFEKWAQSHKLNYYRVTANEEENIAMLEVLVKADGQRFANGGKTECKYKFGGMVDATKLKYQDFTFTGLTFIIDISKSRRDNAVAMAKQFVIENPQGKKRVTESLISNFEKSPGAYWAVREMIESVVVDGDKTSPETFKEAVQVFKKYYPLASDDWKAALETGLLVKAGDRQYADSPYYFNDPLAIEIREARLGAAMKPVIKKILEA